MKPQIMYIENKTDRNDRGEAWIGKVEFSKTGQTVYFNNQAFKKMKSGGVSGNFYDLETGDEYWISGVKKNGQDRHWAGGGKINIDKEIIEEYLSIVDFEIIDKSNFEIVDVPKTDKAKFSIIENKKFKNNMSESYHVTIKDLKGKTKKELDEMADDPDSVLHELAKKSSVKKEVKKQRKIKKENKENEI